MNIIVLKVIWVLRFLLGTFVKPLITYAFHLFYRSKDHARPLPPVRNPLLMVPAHELARKIRARECSSYEVTRAYVERLREIQPLINCIVKDRFDEALEDAKSVDRMLDSGKPLDAKHSLDNAPLLGVPFSCKECIWVKDMPNATGLVSRKDFRCPENAEIVANTLASGAILLCVTNTSECCMWLESSNHLYGTTRNPYNLSRIVGGSSGGEGCIVSAAGAPFGIGSDIGGSIRMPAFFNGIYGHKPTPGLVSNRTQFPPGVGMQEFMLATGPLCRYASDLPLLLKVMSGKPALAENKAVDLSKLRFFYMRDLQGSVLTGDHSADSKQALQRAIDFLERDLGVRVQELRLSKFKCALQIWSSMMANGHATSNTFNVLLRDNKTEPFSPLAELAKVTLGQQKTFTLPALGLAICERIPLHQPKHYVEVGNKLRQQVKEVLGDDGVLLCPGFTVCAPFHHQALFTHTFDFINFGIWNALGFPVTQCPMGLSASEQLPTGVQVVVNQACDHVSLAVAKHFEARLVGWTPAFDVVDKTD